MGWNHQPANAIHSVGGFNLGFVVSTIHAPWGLEKPVPLQVPAHGIHHRGRWLWEGVYALAQAGSGSFVEREIQMGFPLKPSVECGRLLSIHFPTFCFNFLSTFTSGPGKGTPCLPGYMPNSATESWLAPCRDLNCRTGTFWRITSADFQTHPHIMGNPHSWMVCNGKSHSRKWSSFNVRII